jgi:hypothetical protein
MSVSDHMGKCQDFLRARGLRPVQIWVPDTSSSDFSDKCRQQSLLVKGDPLDDDINEWLEAVADTHGWE